MNNEQTGIGFQPPVKQSGMSEKDLLEKEATDMLSQLNVINDDSISRMPEKMFVEIFLPMFMGDEKQHRLASPGAWASYAGNVYREVIVFDQLGAELFRVPPLVAPAPIDVRTDRSQRRSMFDELATAQQHLSRHPQHGEQYMRDVFSRLSNGGYNSTQVINYLERWNTIFKRYGKPEIPLPASTKNASENPVDVTAEEENWDIV
jgi:hypothetical protein